MSYTDQTRRSSPASIAAVVGVHVAIAYALISGLAFNVIKHIPFVTTADILPDDRPPPPPIDQPLPKKPVVLPNTMIPVPRQLPEDTIKPQETIVQTVTAVDLGASSGGGTVVLPPPPPAKPDLSRGAVPAADRLQWITTEDYPSAALRQGIAGTVVISTQIGTDGRVRGCQVTQSSGSALLDDATCRLYTRRAHFTPARDADGNPVAATRTDRFRWQIPND